MDDSESEDFAQRFLPVLKNILESKNIDVNYLDKILASVGEEIQALDSVISTCTLCEWLSDTIEHLKKTDITLLQAEFLCRFIELLSKRNETFHVLQSKNLLNELISLLKTDLMKHTTLKITFIKMLSVMLDNDSGYTWICTSQVWKLVVSIYCSSVNLYVEREGMKFFNKLISAAKPEHNISEDIFLDVFLPIEENLETIIKDKKINSTILPSLKLFEIILAGNLFSENSDFHTKAKKICNFETFLNHLVENIDDEVILEAALVSKVLLSILKIEDKKTITSADSIPAILDIFKILIENSKFNSVIKLAKYCQALWNKIRNKLNCEDTTGVNFILIQLFPSMMCINLPNTNTQYDLFAKNLFTQKSPDLQKFFHLFGNAIKTNFGPKPSSLAAKSISSVLINLNNYNLEEAVLILKAVIFLTQSIISENGYDLEATAKRPKKLGSCGIQDTTLLSAILNGVSLLLDKFKINWSNLEELDFFKIIQCLLKISDLPPLVVVQTLKVVKVSVFNCISSDVKLHSINSNLKTFGSIIYMLMTNSNWEIRDSCIEVVTAMVQLENPAFEQLLLEKNFSNILMCIIEDDTESYVRASALRALTVMTKSKVLNPFFDNQDSCLKITKLLETESEGIVRREAALLIKEIYLTLTDQHDDLKQLFYRVMAYTALCDLYWEVKVNSLHFWEAAIQCMILDTKVTHGSLSNANYEEMSNFSKDDEKLSLYKSMKKLSKIGCLHVLITILKEDCDIIVIKKSAEILSDLLNILKEYNVTATDNTPSCATKRKSDSVEDEKRKIPNADSILKEEISLFCDQSEKVIDDIVNDTDINLLKTVSPENEEIESSHKLTFIKEIEPEVFLLQMQGFDKDKFLGNIQKSFMNVETDLTSTMNKINIEHSVNEINIMDCY